MAGLALPAAAHASLPVKIGGAGSPTWAANVKRVDGPGLLTMVANHQTFAVRIAGIDSPTAAASGAAAQCGAPQATAALQAIVAAHPALELSLVRARGADPKRAAAVVPVRDLAGRYVADVTYAGATGAKNVGLALVAQGWAVAGFPVGSEGQAVRGSLWALQGAALSRASTASAAPAVTAALGAAGLWGLCGGRVHLPATSVVPASAPAAWKVNAAGVLTAIGRLAVKASAQGKGTTVAQVRAAYPSAEITTDGSSCFLSVPEAGVLFDALDVAGEGPGGVGQRSLRCGRAIVSAAFTDGPGVPVGSGGKTGDPAAAVLAADPSAGLGAGTGAAANESLYFGTNGTAVASAPSAAGMLPLGTVEGVTAGPAQVLTYAQAAFLAPFD